jgi:hypothetical protein
MLLVNGRNGQEPIYYPRWYVCLDNQFGAHVLFCVETDDKQWMPLDMRVIWRIRGDIARQPGMTEEKANNLVEEAQRQKKNAAMQQIHDDEADFAEANKKKIAQALAEPESEANNLSHTVREAKAFSYAGKSNFRSTSEQSGVKLTPEELGWELPKSFQK